MNIKILLADDHKIVREGFRAILENEPSFEIVGCADNGSETVRMAHELSPDLLVLDITMPGMSGIEVIHEIMESTPTQKILVLSMHQEIALVVEVIRMGARGYLPKTCSADELIQAIQNVASGEIYYDQEVSKLLINDFLNASESKNYKRLLSSLSQREQEVLRLISEGKITKEAAHVLNVTTKTVDFHRMRIMKKLKLNTIAELTRYAIREGLTST